MAEVNITREELDARFEVKGEFRDGWMGEKHGMGAFLIAIDFKFEGGKLVGLRLPNRDVVRVVEGVRRSDGTYDVSLTPVASRRIG